MAKFLDFINFVAFRNIRRALGLQFLEVKEGKTPSGVIELPVFRVGPVEIHRAWRPRLYGGDDPLGRWRDKNGGSGEDLVSLITHMSSSTFLKRAIEAGDTPLMREANVLFDADASEDRSSNVLMQRLGIKPGTAAMEQKSGRRGWQQVPYASRSSPSLTNSTPGDISPWPDCNITRLPFLGLPQQLYEFRDADGRIQMYFGEWLIEGHPSLWLAFTLWHPTADPLAQKWLLLRSSLPTAPFGLDVAQNNPSATIIILDDVSRTADLNRARDASDPVVFIAWPRAMDGASPSDTDWSGLLARNALIAIDDNRTSVEQGVQLTKLLDASGAARMSILVDPPGSLHSPTLFERALTVDQFREFAYEQYGLTSAPQTEATNEWRPGDPISDGVGEDIVKPFAGRGAISLLVSRPGGGKTALACGIACSAAAGVALFDRMKVTKSWRVLYLRSERNDGVQDWINLIATQLGPEVRDNLVVVPERMNKKYRPPNLLDGESWGRLADKIATADVIFLDYLTNFTGGRDGPAEWKRLMDHMDPLLAAGKSFVILHHTNKQGDQSGTEDHLKGVNISINLRATSFKNGTQISFDKLRDVKEFGRYGTGFKLYWDQDEETGAPIWWTEEPDGEHRQHWKSASSRNETSRAKLSEEYLEAQFQGLAQKIVRSLAAARSLGQLCLSQPQIREKVGGSKSSVLSSLNALVRAEKIVIQGEGRGTRYMLSPMELAALFP